MSYLILGLVVLFALLGLIVQLRILPHSLTIGGLRAANKERARQRHEVNVTELMQYADEQKRKSSMR